MERLILAGWVVLVISFAIIQGLAPQRGDYPNLETRLYELSIARNPARYAATHKLYYIEGKVRAVIELVSEDAEIPSTYHLQIEVRHGRLVQALVPISELRPLSKEPAVRLIRTPLEIYPKGEEGTKDEKR